jgi:hypothetical protein
MIGGRYKVLYLVSVRVYKQLSAKKLKSFKNAAYSQFEGLQIYHFDTIFYHFDTVETLEIYHFDTLY